jgi:hypothetical protein
MIRKCALASVAGIILSVTAITPGRAADLSGGYRGGVYGTSCLRFYNGLPVSFGYGLCYRTELVPTPWGPRWRLVNHCC